jgi:hypothetical protein
VDKRRVWEALRDCKDEQLYTANASVVDLGLIYDVRVRGDVVHVVMAMPDRGRPRYGYFAWGSGGNSQPIRQRLMKDSWRAQRGDRTDLGTAVELESADGCRAQGLGALAVRESL